MQNDNIFIEKYSTCAKNDNNDYICDKNALSTKNKICKNWRKKKTNKMKYNLNEHVLPVRI